MMVRISKLHVSVGLTGVAFAVAVAALLLGAGAGPSARAQGAGGPVVLMGIDAEDGGLGGHGPISVYVDVTDSILAQVTNGGAGILVIGGGKDPADDVTEFWDEIGTGTGEAVTYANGATDIAAQSFDGFAMIGVASSEPETSFGGLTQEENDALAARADDVAAFVNAGGGLLAFSQAGLTNPYAYIGELGTFEVMVELGYDNIEPTAEGLAVGITDDLDICCWHDVYLQFPDFLQVLALNDDQFDDGFGEAAALGGTQVIIGETPTPTPTPAPAETPTPTPAATPTPTQVPAALPPTGSAPAGGGTPLALLTALLAGAALVGGAGALWAYARRNTG